MQLPPNLNPQATTLRQPEISEGRAFAATLAADISRLASESLAQWRIVRARYQALPVRGPNYWVHIAAMTAIGAAVNGCELASALSPHDPLRQQAPALVQALQGAIYGSDGEPAPEGGVDIFEAFRRDSLGPAPERVPRLATDVEARVLVDTLQKLRAFEDKLVPPANPRELQATAQAFKVTESQLHGLLRSCYQRMGPLRDAALGRFIWNQADRLDAARKSAQFEAFELGDIPQLALSIDLAIQRTLTPEQLKWLEQQPQG